MNPFLSFVREAAPGLGLKGADPDPIVSNPTVGDTAAELVQAPTTLIVAVVFGLLTLIGLKFLISRKHKAPVALVILALMVGTLSAFLSSAQGPANLSATVQGYRTFVDGFVFGLAMLVGILHLGLIIFPTIRNVSPPKGAAIAAGMFFVIFGLSSIPEISQTVSVRAILISLSGTLGLAAAVLVSNYVTDGFSKLGNRQPGGVKLLSLAAWFWLFYPLTGILAVFLLSERASLFVYDVVHLLAVTISSVAIFLLDPTKESAVAVDVSAKSGAGAETPKPVEPTEPESVTTVVRKPETPRTVIGRPVRPSRPTPQPGGPGVKDIPKAPPPPKPKRRY